MRRLDSWQAEFPGTPDIRGQAVFDMAGQAVGLVEAAYVDTGSQGKIRFLVVGGRLIPVDAIRGVADGRITIGHRAEQVRASPPLPDEVVLLPESSIARVYAHYGYTPHWDADNTLPGRLS